MAYLTYSATEHGNYPLCFLVPSIRKEEIQKEYIDPFEIPHDDVLVLDLHYSQDKKKTPAEEMKEFITSELVRILEDMQVKYIAVADADYFKLLTKVTKVDVNLGYVLDCAYGPWKVAYIPNYRSVFYDPVKVRAKIKQGMEALVAHASNSYEVPGNDIIHFAEYPRTNKEIEAWLERLLAMDCDLTIDIEAFDLKHHKAGIGTITFCWSKHEGIAFPVDYVEIPGATEAPFGRQVRNEEIRILLRSFFERYLRRAIYHSISYDVYDLIYQLYMTNLLDNEGLLQGIEILLRNWEDTKLITYLATNSCAGNKLSLKDQAQEYSGNYAQSEIADITRIPLTDLLRYNLIDGLSTWYVYEKYWQTMIDDKQEEIYINLFKPATIDIIQMQLTGLPVNKQRAIEVNAQLTKEEEALNQKILSNPIIEEFTRDYLNVEYANKMNAKWKKKRITPQEANQVFNPNSDQQKRALFFTWLQLPVINLTDSKLPSTNGETIEALMNHTDHPLLKELLESFQLLSIINTLTTNFMPNILTAVEGPDGWHYLFGNYNLGGTISGRLSSSDPNLQNLPSTGKGHKIKLVYIKMVKSCFQAPPGWMFCGVDFASLEDRISALTTKDPNKLKVYTDGYDGHSLRAFAYFGKQMPDIDGNSVDSINSIQKKYKPLRDRSKNPTFTLTYQGTWHALVKKYGFTPEQAKEVERLYHVLYEVSDAWVNKQLDAAMTDGYITAAFGLRLRTPLLKQVIRGNSKTPYEAEAEGRTAGNALGQSWCLLNSRAWVEFMQKVRQSKFRCAIRPCAQIHDAGYALVKDDIAPLMFMNEHLIEAVKWQNHPDIWHDEVKIGGELGIFYPNWNTEITIPNSATADQIFEIIEDNLKEKK